MAGHLEHQEKFCDNSTIHGKKKISADFYGNTFQEMLVNTSLPSAQRIVPYIHGLLQPQSVVDVGCGIGAWLATFQNLCGITDFLGFDGAYMNKANLAISSDRFVECDFEKDAIDCSRTFDLAVSLEVAEHLSKERAPDFIRDLTRLAPVVFFSAAIPNQGGTNHLNEQWPSYWAKLFLKHDYVPVDCIRKKFWNDENISFWYQQNSVLYVKKICLERYPKLNDMYLSQNKELPSLVHPKLWDIKLQPKPGLIVRALRKIQRIISTK